MKSLQRAVILLSSLLCASSAGADADAETEVEHAWSVTIDSDFKIITDRHADNELGSFFDQYEFTPNKSRSLPVELGIRNLSYDWFAASQTPRVQLRFDSPTSNLGVSGSEIDQPFLNQRADLFARFEGIELDIDYRRFRTEDLRLFPNTLGRQFQDLTEAGDRFDRERTGVFADLRVRPAWTWLSPELSMRGGYQERDGSQQLRFLQEQSNRWGALEQGMNQETVKAGGGILVAPGGLFTLTLDADHDSFRHDSSTITARKLGSGFLQNDDSVGFIPDSDRLTGTALVQSRIGEWAVLEGGFQMSRLEQVNDSTPTQIAAGLDENELIFYSANAAADLNVSEQIRINAFVKYDQRNNKIQRNTRLFNAFDNLIQTAPYLKRWDRIYAGAEAVYALHRRNIIAVGARYEWIDRELAFGLPTNLAILKPNALVDDRTEMWTVYGRTNLRPLRGLGISGEVGYRGAPETGYVLDLDEYVYGKLRASYTIPIEQTIVVSAFLRGSSGENRDFSLTNGLGAFSSATKTSVKFEREDLTWGVTVTSYPLEDVSVFASFFQSYSKQNYDLVVSNLQRYWQSAVPVNFSDGGSPDHENTQMSFVLGTHVRFTDQIDGDLSYSFTRAELDYDSAGETTNVRRISNNRSIDADIHGVQTQVGYWLRDGLRVKAGYRLQLFDDSISRPSGTGSVVRSSDPSTTQHTITFGVTLTSDLAKNSE